MDQRPLQSILRTIPLLLLAGCAGISGSGESGELEVVALSTQPWLVTGGDVLIGVRGIPTDRATTASVELNGRRVTDRFRMNADGEWVGLVDGLELGANRIEVDVSGTTAGLDLTNYPASGPIISGPHQEPYLCQTAEFELVTGEMLGQELDENCSAERRIDYVYLSSATGEFAPYPGAASPPTDVATATTMTGATVPFIVRVVTGTTNRAVYESAILHDPADPAPDPWTRSEGWNGKLVYTHGGGCRGGWYQQGDQTGGVLNEGLLSMGYGVTSASLNVFGQNCNDLLASETHIMVKERFVEAYGAPIYTIATGASGGSYQSHQTADNYPGVFDGIIVSSSFSDVTSSTIFTLADSRLLYHYFNETAPGTFSEEEERAVAGFGSHGSIANLSAGAARLDPTWEGEVGDEMQGGEVSLTALEEMRYSEQNPQGIRATVYDATRNVYGTDLSNGAALRPLDNAGVQYGLAALNAGDISTDQFIDLNARIGGFDRDLNPVAERHHADPTASQRAYETGRILYGGAGLATTPVIDYRSYTDHRPGGDIHMIVHQFSTRARLEAANGNADNHVMAVGGEWGFTEDRPDLRELFLQMDQWLTNIASVEGGAAGAMDVVRSKPASLTDMCWDTRGATRTAIREKQSFEGGGECGEIYPAYPTPRHVAGAPLANDVVTCQLKPVDASDYEVEFTSAELDRLRSIFPHGVCDWTRPDPNNPGYGGTWRSFGPSPVNEVD